MHVFGHPGCTYMSTWFCYAKLGATHLAKKRKGKFSCTWADKKLEDLHNSLSKRYQVQFRFFFSMYVELWRATFGSTYRAAFWYLRTWVFHHIREKLNSNIIVPHDIFEGCIATLIWLKNQSKAEKGKEVQKPKEGKKAAPKKRERKIKKERKRKWKKSSEALASFWVLVLSCIVLLAWTRSRTSLGQRHRLAWDYFSILQFLN